MRIAINNQNAHLGGEKAMRDVFDYFLNFRHCWQGKEIISPKPLIQESFLKKKLEIKLKL